MTDYPDWQAPQAHATAIFNTTVPLGVKSIPVTTYNNNGNPVAAGGTVSSGQVAFNQIGYEVTLTLICDPAETNPTARFQLLWFDSASGLQVGQDNWVLVGGQAPGSTYYGSGPTKGDMVLIRVNNSGTQNMTFTLSMLQNSRVYARDDWRTITYGTIPGFLVALRTLDAGVLGAASVSVAGNQTVQRIIGLYAGNVKLQYANGVNQGTFRVRYQFDPNIAANASHIDTLAAGAVDNVSWSLAREVVVIELQNLAAGASVMSFMVTVSEQQT